MPSAVAHELLRLARKSLYAAFPLLLLVSTAPAVEACTGVECVPLPTEEIYVPLTNSSYVDFAVLGPIGGPPVVEACIGDDYHAGLGYSRDDGFVIWTGEPYGQRAGYATPCPSRG